MSIQEMPKTKVIWEKFHKEINQKLSSGVDIYIYIYVCLYLF